MNDQQIDAAIASATVTHWVTSTEAHLTAVQTVGLRQDIAALVRRVRDAEQERCAGIAKTFEDAAEIEFGQPNSSEFECFAALSGQARDIAAAIRAPRTEEKR